MKLIVRKRRATDPPPTLSFSSYVSLLCAADEGDQTAVDRLNEWAKLAQGEERDG